MTSSHLAIDEHGDSRAWSDAGERTPPDRIDDHDLAILDRYGPGFVRAPFGDSCHSGGDLIDQLCQSSFERRTVEASRARLSF
ncbi:MAG: hypothetical protein ACM3UP_01320 [Methanocella sp.]